jgi:hypothetical protein
MKSIPKIAELILTLIGAVILFVPILIILTITDIKEENRLIKMFD